MFAHAIRKIGDLKVSVYFCEEKVLSGLAYKPRPGDVFVVGYPKTGSTWLQYMVYNILSDMTPVESMSQFLESSPFLEYVGADVTNKMARPGVIKTHLPFQTVPYAEHSKYVYIARNPFDCCVSYYHNTRRNSAYNFEDGAFSEFLKEFLSGNVLYGDYFDHLLGWYEQRSAANVLFLTYEALKADTAACALRVADFLGKEYGERFRQPKLLRKLLDVVSLENTKNILSDEMSTNSHASQNQNEKGIPKTGYFVRKGEVGDWRNHFSKEQTTEMKERIALKLRDSGAMDLWADVDLP